MWLRVRKMTHTRSAPLNLGSPVFKSGAAKRVIIFGKYDAKEEVYHLSFSVVVKGDAYEYMEAASVTSVKKKAMDGH